MARRISCAFTIATVLAAGCEGSSKEPQPAKEAAPVPKKPPKPDVATATVTFEVTVRQLVEDYRANEVGADARYRDKVFRVRGLVGRVGKDGLDRPTVVFHAPLKHGLRADFASDRGLGELKPYDEVVIRCRGDGLFGEAPVLADCLFEKREDAPAP